MEGGEAGSGGIGIAELRLGRYRKDSRADVAGS